MVAIALAVGVETYLLDGGSVVSGRRMKRCGDQKNGGPDRTLIVSHRPICRSSTKSLTPSVVADLLAYVEAENGQR